MNWPGFYYGLGLLGWGFIGGYYLHRLRVNRHLDKVEAYLPPEEREAFIRNRRDSGMP